MGVGVPLTVAVKVTESPYVDVLLADEDVTLTPATVVPTAEAGRAGDMATSPPAAPEISAEAVTARVKPRRVVKQMPLLNIAPHSSLVVFPTGKDEVGTCLIHTSP